MMEQEQLVEKILTLKHNSKTDLEKGQINNQDFIILLISALGNSITMKQLKEYSVKWRGSITLQTYFGPHNGYTGNALDSKDLYRNPSHRFHGYCSGAPNHPPYWFRASAGKPYTNSLTIFGLERLAQLIKQL